jgi:hypothetical protein
MATFMPVAVDTVKPEVVVLVTVPDAPPGSGPDRALEPPPAPKLLLAGELLLAGDEPPPVVALTIP